VFAYARITPADNDTPEHSALALRAARESMVLLKNDGLLPLDPARLKRVAVIGANADDTNMLRGNYNGTPSHPVSILQGLRDALGPGVDVTYARGCPLAVRAPGAPVGPGRNGRPGRPGENNAIGAPDKTG